MQAKNLEKNPKPNKTHNKNQNRTPADVLHFEGDL